MISDTKLKILHVTEHIKEEHMLPDETHMNKKGYRVWTEKVLGVAQEMCLNTLAGIPYEEKRYMQAVNWAIPVYELRVLGGEVMREVFRKLGPKPWAPKKHSKRRRSKDLIPCKVQKQSQKYHTNIYKQQKHK